MIKKYILTGLLVILILVFSNSLAQSVDTQISTGYKTLSNVFYYETDSTRSDRYLVERCRLDLYYPTEISSFPTIVWFHGGGLKGGDRFIPGPLKNNHIAIAAVGYRLYPQVTCPAYIEDAAAAVAWVFKNIQKYGGNPELIFVSGHSAGGYLTMMIGLDKKWLAAHGIDANRIAGLAPFSGHTITHFAIREERGIPGEQPIVDALAPLFHVRSDAPSLVLITGDRNQELLGRYEENAYLMRMMQVVGHQSTTLYELQGFDHGGMAEPAYFILLKYIENRLKEIR